MVLISKETAVGIEFCKIYVVKGLREFFGQRSSNRSKAIIQACSNGLGVIILYSTCNHTLQDEQAIKQGSGRVFSGSGI